MAAAKLRRVVPPARPGTIAASAACCSRLARSSRYRLTRHGEPARVVVIALQETCITGRSACNYHPHPPSRRSQIFGRVAHIKERCLHCVTIAGRGHRALTRHYLRRYRPGDCRGGPRRIGILNGRPYCGITAASQADGPSLLPWFHRERSPERPSDRAIVRPAGPGFHDVCFLACGRADARSGRGMRGPRPARRPGARRVPSARSGRSPVVAPSARNLLSSAARTGVVRRPAGVCTSSSVPAAIHRTARVVQAVCVLCFRAAARYRAPSRQAAFAVG